MEEWRIRKGRMMVEETRRKAMEALGSIYAGQQRGGAATRRDSDEAMEAAFVDQMEEWRELGLGVFNKLFKFHSSNPGHAYSCLEAISVDLNLDLETLRESYSDYASRTLLHHAAHQGWCSAIRWLREYGPANAGRNYLGPSRLLHTAVENGHCDAVAILLDAGEQIESLDGVGHTPLLCAADQNLCNMCKLLLKRGASLDSKDRTGKTPEEYARLVGKSQDAADLLAAVRAAGGWDAYVAQPRAALLAFRRDLPTLRRLGPSSVRAHEWLFAEAPADVCTHALAFWQSDRDSEY
jgi:ankyrin